MCFDRAGKETQTTCKSFGTIAWFVELDSLFSNKWVNQKQTIQYYL